MTFYDPPAGWQYGFPREYKPLPGETIHDTLIRDGYPPDMARLYHTYCRFWGRREEDVIGTTDAATEAGQE